MIQKRLIQYIDYKGISKYRFYKETGLSNGFLDKKGTIGVDKCEIIYSVYPDINFEWLITGKGDMLKEPTITERMDNFAIKNGLTLHSLGLIIGLSALETDNLIDANEATEEQINSICEKFDIPNDWFLTGKGEMPRVDKSLINTVSEPQSTYIKEDNKTTLFDKEIELLRENIISLKETNELLKYKIKSLEAENEVLKTKQE